MLPEPTTSHSELNHIDTGKSISHIPNGDCRMFSPIFDNGMLSNFTRACGDVEAAILALRLKFKSANTKLKSPRGKKVITMSRQNIANLYGWSVKKVDNLIPKLSKTGIVRVYKDKWRNKEQYFFEFDDKMLPFPIHITAFNTLVDEIGTVKETLLYSYVIYRLRNSNIAHNNTQWCALTKQEIATFLNISDRTVAALLDNLKEKGILKTENFLHNKQRCLHITVGKNDMQFCVDKYLNKKIDATVTPIQSAKQSTGHPARNPAVPHEDIPPKVIHNPHGKKGEGDTEKRLAVYIDNKIKENKSNITVKNRSKNDLTPKQKKYAQAALRKTLVEKGREHLFPQYWPEVEFSLTNPQQHRDTENFKHKLNRIMSLIRDGAWGTPHGFKNHSEAGQKMTTYRKSRMAEHEKFKQLECSPSSLHRLAV